MNAMNIGDAAKLAAEGFTFLCISEPTILMEDALKRLNDGVKSTTP